MESCGKDENKMMNVMNAKSVHTFVMTYRLKFSYNLEYIYIGNVKVKNKFKRGRSII